MKMATCLDNLTVAVSADKNVLEKLASTNEKLLEQLTKRANKYEMLASNGSGETSEKDGVTTLNVKNYASSNMKRTNATMLMDLDG